MTSDPLIKAFLSEMNKIIKDETESLVSAPFEQMYTVGRLQGRIDGLKTALETLYKISEEQDT